MNNVIPDKNIPHVQGILQKIQHQYFIDKDVQPIINSIDFFLLFYELLRSMTKGETKTLETTLFRMKMKKVDFNVQEFSNNYSHYSEQKDKTDKDCEFYVHLNFNIDFGFTLNGFTVSKLEKEEKETLNYHVKEMWGDLPQSNREIRYDKSEVYCFKIRSNDRDTVIDNFYSTLNLFKGIMEFSYNRVKWNLKLDEQVKNRMSLSTFKYPPFVYIRTNGLVELIPHEDYPYDYDHDDRQVKTMGDYLFFKHLLKLISENQFDKGMKEMMSDCFRLYGMGIDTPYVDQSFLYFWNVLERVTMSVTGNTEQVLNNVKIFVSSEFWNDNTNSIKFLKEFRNTRVHRGTGEVSILDLNLLKYLCDHSLLYLVGNPPGSQKNITSIKQLEVFYGIKDNQNLHLIKDMVDFVVQTKKVNNNV